MDVPRIGDGFINPSNLRAYFYGRYSYIDVYMWIYDNFPARQPSDGWMDLGIEVSTIRQGAQATRREEIGTQHGNLPRIEEVSRMEAGRPAGW